MTKIYHLIAEILTENIISTSTIISPSSLSYIQLYLRFVFGSPRIYL